MFNYNYKTTWVPKNGCRQTFSFFAVHNFDFKRTDQCTGVGRMGTSTSAQRQRHKSLGVYIFTRQRCILCELYHSCCIHRYNAGIAQFSRIDCKANSHAETSYKRKSIFIEFTFGLHYVPQTLLLFTMSTIYGVICPLIMPFAMF